MTLPILKNSRIAQLADYNACKRANLPGAHIAQLSLHFSVMFLWSDTQLPVDAHDLQLSGSLSSHT